MLQVTSDQWLYWLNLYFWPLLRVLALISTAPILSERAIPKRVKLGLGLMITVVIAPSLPANDVPIFSIAALWLAMQQILIGIALGFTMQFAFAAVRTAGELIGLQMGLSFATFFDPGSRLNMPVLARLMDLLAMLLFLTFNGHLWLISLLVDTFHTLPIGGHPVNSNAFLALARAGSNIPQRADAGSAGDDAVAHAQPRARIVKSYGSPALRFCHWLSADPDGRYFFNGRINAINCPILRTIIQRNF